MIHAPLQPPPLIDMDALERALDAQVLAMEARWRAQAAVYWARRTRCLSDAVQGEVA